MTSTDIHVEDLTEAGADALLEAMRASSMEPQGLDSHQAEAIEVAMAITERYGSWTSKGFSPFLVRPVEVDAREYALVNGKPAPVALRLVQRGMLDAATDPDNLIGRVVLNTSHVDDNLAPHIIAIYAPTGSAAFRRGSLAVAFLYQPTEWVGDDGRRMASWYNRQGISGLVHEWTDYEEAEADVAELRQAIETLRRASADQARLDGEQLPEETDRQVRKPRPAAW